MHGAVVAQIGGMPREPTGKKVSSRTPQRVSRLMDELFTYLENHPDAADTFDGIMNWWLPRQRYETERQYIEQALQKLVESKRIVKKTLVDGTTLYSRADREVASRRKRRN